MTSRHRSLALIFAVGVVTAGALALSRRADTKLPADLVDAARPSFAYSFTPGRRLTYDVDYRSEALVDGALERASASENAPRVDSVLTLSSTFAGTLTVTVVDHRADGSARVLATLSDLEVDVVLSDRNVTLPDATFAPLARGFFIEYGPSGEVRGIAVEEDANPVAGRLASQIVAFLQLQVPRGHGASWETDEKDGLGDLHARYSLVDDAPSHPGGQLIQKLVTRQLAPPRAERPGGAPCAGRRARAIGRRAAPARPVELRAAERRSENEALLARVDIAAIVADARAHPPPPQSREAATYARILSAAVDASTEARARSRRSSSASPTTASRTPLPSGSSTIRTSP